MSGPPKYDRKADVKRIRKSGQIAAMEGRSRDNNPYSRVTMDNYQWDQGWLVGKQYRDEMQAIQERQANSPTDG